MLATAGALHNRNGLADHGGIVAASPHTAHTDAARQDSVAPSTAGPAEVAGAATPPTLRLDGPMRQLVADTPPPGADVVDGATLTVTDPVALRAWLTAQRAVYEDSRAGERRLWRAAGRLLNQVPGQDASAHLHSGTSADSAASTADSSVARTTRTGPHPAAVATATVSRRVPPPASSDGATAVDGAAVRPVTGSAAAGAQPTRPRRGTMR